MHREHTPHLPPLVPPSLPLILFLVSPFSLPPPSALPLCVLVALLMSLSSLQVATLLSVVTVSLLLALAFTTVIKPHKPKAAWGSKDSRGL